jgi:hypothetical protein
LLDLFFGFVILIIAIVICFAYANKAYKNDIQLRKTFKLSITLKLVSALLFGCLHQFYYGYGDTLVYYRSGVVYFKFLCAQPKALYDFIFLNPKLVEDKYFFLADACNIVIEYFNNANIMVHKFVLFTGWIVGYSYYGLNIIFALICFLGCWRMHNSLRRCFPQYAKYIKYSFLYIPSLVFWTAGVGKDAICIGLLNLAASMLIEAVVNKKTSLVNILLIVFFIFIVFIVKAYIVLAFFPFFLYFLASLKIKLAASIAQRRLLKLATITALTTVLAFAISSKELVAAISDEVIRGALNITRSQMAVQVEGDAMYNLGVTPADIINKNIAPFILPSINVALFRPFVTDVKKPMQIFTFLESAIFLLLTIYVFVKGLIYKTIKIILQNKFVLFCFLFTIIFAFFVGLVSANFGTLVRYKAPFVSYFLLGLLITLDELNSKKKLLLHTKV